MPTTETEKPRKQFMKWLKLGADKDPDFEKDLFLTDGVKFYCGVLEKIEQVQVGKKYSFKVGDNGVGADLIESSMTHYCNPVPVK